MCLTGRRLRWREINAEVEGEWEKRFNAKGEEGSKGMEGKEVGSDGNGGTAYPDSEGDGRGWSSVEQQIVQSTHQSPECERAGFRGRGIGSVRVRACQKVVFMYTGETTFRCVMGDPRPLPDGRGSD